MCTGHKQMLFTIAPKHGACLPHTLLWEAPGIQNLNILFSWRKNEQDVGKNQNYTFTSFKDFLISLLPPLPPTLLMFTEVPPRPSASWHPNACGVPGYPGLCCNLLTCKNLRFRAGEATFEVYQVCEVVDIR